MSTTSNQSSPLQGMEERPEWSFRRDKRGACSFFRAPASSIVPYKDITLADIYHYITGPYAAERTAKLRSIDDKKTKGLWKRTKFDYEFTDNSRVIDGNSRSAEASLRSKGARLNEVRRLLLSDPHFETLLLFTSPSGNGLKWVIPIDLEQCEHRTWFNAVRNYLAATYHLDADPACVNVSRSCFLPHDPDCYIAPRLLPELAPAIEANPAVEDLMVSLGATIIQMSVNNQGDTIADKTSENNEQAE